MASERDQVGLMNVGNDLYKVVFDVQHGRLDIRHSDPNLPIISNSLVNLTCSDSYGKLRRAGFSGMSTTCSDHPFADVHGKGTQYQVTGSGKDGLQLTFLLNFYEQRPFLLFRLVIVNRGRNNLYLHDINLLQATAESRGRVAFHNSQKAPDFFKVGWHDWVYSGLRHSNQHDVDSIFFMKPFTGKMLYNPGTPISKSNGEFWGEGWGLITDHQSALLAGFVSTADQFGLLHVKCRPEATDLTMTAQADGILLEPGDEFASEWGYLEFINLPNPDPAASYVEAVARQMKARLPVNPPPAQWTHWYHYFQHITEDLFIDNLKTIDNIKNTIPYKIVQLDDGYQSAWGDWTTCNDKFPNGLAHLSKTIKDHGYISGLWLAPFVVDPRSKTACEHPDWLVKDRKGKPIISGYFYDFYGNALDLTQPAVLDHVRSLMNTVAHEWGFGFVKTDFVYSGALPGIRQNPKMTRAQAFRRGMETVRQGIGEETYLLGCGCPFGPAIGLVDAMRIGPDTAPNWTPYLWTVKWATPLIKNEMSIGSLRNNIRHTLNMSALHKRWWWNDPDCVMVRDYDTTLNEDEVKSNLSLVGLSGGLMISSDDLTRLVPERQKLVALLTPLLGQAGQPLDLLEREMAELYVLPVDKGWGRWHDVAVFNWSDSRQDRWLDLRQLGYAPGEKVHVFDFWASNICMADGGGLALEQLPAHGCRLLRVCRAGDGPQLIGDTLHITQGGEIENWLAAGKMLKLITIDLDRDASGSLWIKLPGKPASAVCNSQNVLVSPVGDSMYKLDLSFHGRAEISIEWE